MSQTRLPLSLLDALAEKHIDEARTRGELSDLPGEGRPLPAEDNALVPEELRAAYRLLKNAGLAPAELAPLTEIRDIEKLLQGAGSDDERLRLLTRLQWLLNRRHGGRPVNLQIEARDYTQYLERLAARRTPDTD
jgi:hypothetical protein